MKLYTRISLIITIFSTSNSVMPGVNTLAISDDIRLQNEHKRMTTFLQKATAEQLAAQNSVFGLMSSYQSKHSFLITLEKKHVYLEILKALKLTLKKIGQSASEDTLNAIIQNAHVYFGAFKNPTIKKGSALDTKVKQNTLTMFVNDRSKLEAEIIGMLTDFKSLNTMSVQQLKQRYERLKEEDRDDQLPLKRKASVRHFKKTR